MIYAEASYFDGYHFAHIAAHVEHVRLKRITDKLQQLRERR